MSRWMPLPLELAAASPAIAALSPSARVVWLALRIAHARHGLGGVVPARHATPLGIALSAPAMVLGVDVDAALGELRSAGLVCDGDDGVVLADLDDDGDLLRCSRCRCRNPDPRSSRCPRCQGDDGARRRGSADAAQTTTTPMARAATPRAKATAQELRRECAEMPQGARDESSAPHAHARGRAWQGMAGQGHQTRAARGQAPPQTPARPAGEPASPAADAPAAPDPEPVTVARTDPSGDDDELGGPDPAEVCARIERWVAQLARRGILRLTDAHLPDVVGLVDQLGPRIRVDGDHAVARDRRAALRNSRIELARRVIAWCPSPERLGRWLVRVSRWYRPRNLAGYLRRAAQRGDPGTVLEGRTRRIAGRGAETWRDFGAATERALDGGHLVDVQQLVAGTAAVLGEVDEAARDRLRAELREHLRAGRAAAAKTTLLRLVPHVAAASDDELRLVLRGALSPAEARRIAA